MNLLSHLLLKRLITVSKMSYLLDACPSADKIKKSQTLSGKPGTPEHGTQAEHQSTGGTTEY